MKVDKIISLIKENKNGIIVPFILFIGTLLANHLNNTSKMGYLSFFDINSFYDINVSNFYTFLTSFILLILLSVSIYFIPYYFNKKFPLPALKHDHKIIVLHILHLILHLILYIVITWILLQILFISVVKIKNWDIEICDILKTSLLTIELLFSSIIIAVVEIINEYMIKISDYNINFLSKNKNKKAENENDKQTESQEKLDLPHYLLYGFALVLLLFPLNILFFEFGEMAAQSHSFYPSFTENNKEYIVIAKMESQNYLIVELPTKKTDDKNTICFIKDISNIPLVDKNINGIYN